MKTINLHDTEAYTAFPKYKEFIIQKFTKDFITVGQPSIFQWYDTRVIDACVPFAQLKYSYMGFAETEKLNTPDECFNEIIKMFNNMIDVNAKGKLYMPAKSIKDAIKREQERYKSQNAGSFGRYFARLVHLLEESKIQAQW